MASTSEIQTDDHFIDIIKLIDQHNIPHKRQSLRLFTETLDKEMGKVLEALNRLALQLEESNRAFDEKLALQKEESDKKFALQKEESDKNFALQNEKLEQLEEYLNRLFTVPRRDLVKRIVRQK